MTVHLLSQLSPSQTLRVPIFKLHCCLFSAQKSSSNRYEFSVLNSILLVFVFFPLDCSHLFMILRWVCVSLVTLCPCLTCENYWFSLSLILLLVLFFIMCLTRVCLLVTHLVWSYVVMLFHNVPFLNVWFTVLNLPVLLCAFIGSICEFYYTDYESCHSHHIVFRIFSPLHSPYCSCVSSFRLVHPCGWSK